MNKKIVLHARDNIDVDFPVKIYKKDGQMHQYEHAHDYIQLWYVLKGECVHLFNNKEYTLTKGSVFVLPPNVSHSLVSEENSELIGLEFTEAFISEAVDKSENFLNYCYIKPFVVSVEEIKPAFLLEGSESKAIEILLDEIMDEFERNKSFYELFIKANVLKILAIISRAYDKRIDKHKALILDKHKASVNLALEYINNNYQRKIYLKDICKISMMSTANFSFVFKCSTGRTLTEYVNELKIKKAKELLHDNNISIRGIALKLGFTDATYFNKVFKNLVGVSPLNYRKNIK